MRFRTLRPVALELLRAITRLAASGRAGGLASRRDRSAGLGSDPILQGRAVSIFRASLNSHSALDCQRTVATIGIHAARGLVGPSAVLAGRLTLVACPPEGAPRPALALPRGFRLAARSLACRLALGGLAVDPDGPWRAAQLDPTSRGLSGPASAPLGSDRAGRPVEPSCWPPPACAGC